jgi:hypothetical protein
MTVYGDFTNSGGTFDFRQGSSGTTLRALNTTFAGSTNSVITVGTYASSNNDFNGITINKSGGAKIILGSDVTVDPGASTGVSQLNLTSGIIQTGNFVLYVLSTTTSDVVNASSSSYVNGALGRGMSNSAGKANVFAVGDNNGYRPITVRSTTGGTATGHNVVVRCVSGNANIGSTSFLGGIDTVSRVRYYQISYNKGIGSGATSMSFNQFSPSYGTDDGVAAGNYDLRVAYSTDNRTTWNGMTQGTAHLTSLASPPTTITPSQLGTALTLNTGTGYIYAALARVSGTSTNFLPVELISFSCIGNGNAIELNWTTATEKNNFGFDIERKVNGDDWTKIAFIAGHGTTNSPHTYAYTDQSASHGIIYLYRLKQINDDGSFTYSDEISASLTEMPTAFYLYQNYPNPFNPNTKLKIALPKESKASVIVYNTLGETIRTLVDEVLPAGFHNLYLNLPNEASGTYLVRFTADNYVQTKKILLMK